MTIDRIREVLAPTDPAILEAGAGGERLVARARVVFWMAVWLIPLTMLLMMSAPPPEVWIGFGASSVAVAVSVSFLVLVRRHRGAPLVPFATAACDVTLVTATLALIAMAGRPSVAVHSHVVWPVYLLGIVATAFRLDFRVCIFAGLLAAGQYFALVLWITGLWEVSAPELTAYGPFSWATQISKLLLLGVAAALTCGIIHQGRKFARVAGNDRLTGLGNRALFDEKIRIELSRADRAHSPISLAFVDIDHFKTFNDRWGHDTGDDALRLVADVLRAEARVTDSVFRWGGEEMIVFCPDTDAAGVELLLERVRAALQDLTLPGVPADVRVTVSAGVAEFPSDGTSPEELIRRADRRLLMAKRCGRDRIIGPERLVAVVRAS